MLGLTKTRRQADMRKSGPSGKRQARFFAAHRYRKSGPRKTAFTGLRKKTNDCRYIDDAGACITPKARGGGSPPSKGIGRRVRKEHGKSKERAREGHGESKERARREQGESKERARKGQGGSTERARREQGGSKEEARREQGGSTEEARREQEGSKKGARREQGKGTKGLERPGEGQMGARSASKKPAGEGKNRLERESRLRCMDTKKPAPSSGAGTLLDRSQIRASRHCQPSHARGWRTHA